MEMQRNLLSEEVLNQNLLLMQENAAFKNENLLLKNRIAELTEQLNWLKKQIFGKKSERIIEPNANQLTFDFFDDTLDTKVEREQVASHTRAKPNRNGQDKIVLPPDLPKETIVLDIPEDKKIVNGKALVKIGEEVSQKLAHRPGEYYIKEIIRPKYALPNEGVLTAKLPDSIIARCHADESFLAEMLVQKFGDHLPLYRISEILSRQGIYVSHKLMSQWAVRCGMILTSLCNAMLKEILAGETIFVDETPVKFIDSERESRLGYLWVVCGGQKSNNPPYRVYNFRTDRKHDNILELLKDYHGSLHSDKYGAYEKLAESKSITWHPCFAHIRRKFFEAETGDASFREWILTQINNLFLIEDIAWKLSPDERVNMRIKQSELIIDDLLQKVKDRLMKGDILLKSKLREALGYCYGLAPYLKNYIRKPFARLDNNVAERAIRPIAIGRKNWLFFGSPNGGIAGCALLSLVQTCRGLGINPREYLEDVLRKIMGHNSQKLYELLPDRWCKNSK